MTDIIIRPPPTLAVTVQPAAGGGVIVQPARAAQPVISPRPVAAVIVSQTGAPGLRGPAGPSGAAAAYIHVQSAPAATWIVNHNLGANPTVSVTDAAGREALAEVLNTSPNQLLVYLSAPATGQVRCI